MIHFFLFTKLAICILQLLPKAFTFWAFFQSSYRLVKHFLNKLQLMWDSAFSLASMQYSSQKNLINLGTLVI